MVLNPLKHSESFERFTGHSVPSIILCRIFGWKMQICGLKLPQMALLARSHMQNFYMIEPPTSDYFPNFLNVS